MKMIVAAGMSAFGMLLGVRASYSPIELDASGNYAAATWGGASVSPENDYRISKGLYIEFGYGGDSTTTTNTFRGNSLAVGIVGGTTGILGHNGGGGMKIENLIMANGYYRTWSASSSNRRKTVIGNATVISPSSAPFKIFPCHDASITSYTVDWDMVFSGESGKGFLVSDNGTGSASTLNIRSSSPDYLGSVGATGAKLTMGIAAADSLGGPLGSFDSAALTLENGVTLKSLADGLHLDASYNRGIEVKSTGGRINVPEGEVFTVGWPISGNGTLEKTGLGTLAFSNTVSVAILATEGSVAAAQGRAVTVQNLTLAGGGFAVATNSSVLSVTELVATDGITIPVRFIGDMESGTTVPFLRLPKGVLSIENFSMLPGSGEYGAPYCELLCSEDGDYEIFSVKALPLVSVKSDSWEILGNTGSYWSDNSAIHEGAAYFVNAKTTDSRHLYLLGKSYDGEREYDYVFPGHSLTLAGRNNFRALLRMIARKLTMDLRVYAGGCVYMTKYNSSGENIRTVSGKIAVNASDFEWQVGDVTTTTTIESDITGASTSRIKFNLPSGSGGGTIVLAGHNEGYKGSLTFAPYLAGATNPFGTLRISDESNLGGNPPSFLSEALRLQRNAIFHPIGSVTIDDENRGLLLNGSGIEFRVDPGETFTLNSTMNLWEAGVTKTGGGTFRLGKVPVNSGGNSLSIDEGYIEAVVPDAFRYFNPITFNGGGLALERVTDALDLRSQYGIVLTNATLNFSAASFPVKVDCGGTRPDRNAEVPVCLVRETNADAFAGHLSMERIGSRGRWVPMRRNVTVGGIVCTLFTARYEVGFSIVIR